MSDTPPRKPPNRLKPEDIKLWKRMTQDVKRTSGHDYLNIDDNAPVSGTKPPAAKLSPNKPKAQSSPAKGNQVDRATHTKLRQGKIRPEASLDLHGMTQDEAHNALISFIKRQYALKKRCVLIITGKGDRHSKRASDHWIDDQHQPGILKRMLPNWVSAPPLSDIVLESITAHHKDGGAGAVYVYLRKHK